MINKKRIGLNVLFSLFQAISIGATYFFLYKYLLQKLGGNEMGVWAIVLAVSSVANIANMGIGTSVVRLTAKFAITNDKVSINKLIHTSIMFLGSIFFCLIFLLYYISPFWLKIVIEQDYYEKALMLIPYSLGGLWLNAISGVLISCLDGFQKNYIRSILYVSSSLFLLFLSIYFVPKYGILGIAFAQLAQAVFLFVSALIAIKLVFREMKIFPLRWDKVIFKNIFSIGMKEQVISLCQLCFDPLTKSMLGSFGSLSLVTYYEMANRLVLQMRSLLVSANQVFIPVFATIDEKSSREQKHALFQKVFSLNLVSTLLWAVLLAGTLIPVSHLWIGSFQIDFLASGLCLIIAYSFNILCSPAYFANAGAGKLNDNVIGNVIICLVNLLLGYVLGFFFGGYGVLVAWSLALAIGSQYIITVYNRKHNLPIQTLFSRVEFWLLILGLVSTVLLNYIFLRFPDLSILQMLTISLLLFGVCCILPVTRHPVLRSLVNKSKLKFSS